MRPLHTAWTAALLAMCAASSTAAAQPAPSCPPAGYDRPALLALKQASFAIADAARRDAFALALTACLADPDPAIRDGVAYEALSTLLRGKQLSSATIVGIRDRLLVMLTGPEGDGFARPFAALVLSEVARTDRVEPWMTVDERSRLVEVAASYVRGVREYRGFDEREGWRHGVAHGADLLMQLAYDPALLRADLDRILDAVASQVTPTAHAYQFGEPERLARPVVAVARRGILTADEWTAWLAGIASPAPLGSWQDAFLTEAGLAKRHNTMAFLSALYVNARMSDAAYLSPLVSGLEAGLRALP